MANKPSIEHKYLDIDLLKPDPLNAKLHPAEQVDAIARNIEKYGMLDPIGIDEDLNIIEGHGRFMACKKLGLKSVPTITLNGLKNAHKRRGYGLAHNQTAMSSGLDYIALAQEKESLDIGDADFLSAGLSPDDVFHMTTFADMMSKAEDEGSGNILGDGRVMAGLIDPVFKASLDFDTEEQYAIFQNFLISLKIKYPAERSIASRLMLWMDSLKDA